MKRALSEIRTHPLRFASLAPPEVLLGGFEFFAMILYIHVLFLVYISFIILPKLIDLDQDSAISLISFFILFT